MNVTLLRWGVVVLLLGPQVVAPALLALPRPDLGAMEPALATRLRAAREELDARIAEGTATGALFGHSGRLYHAHGLVEAAAACYRNAALLEPQEFRWPYLLGVLFQENFRLDEAAASLSRALSYPDRYYPAMVRLATIELARGRLDAADAALAPARAHAPDDPALLAAAGELALARKQYDDAVTLLARALERQPRATRLHYPLAMAYRALGRMQDAREHLAVTGETGLRPLDPVVDEVLALRQSEHVFQMEGHTALRAGDAQGAATAFARALAASGNTSVAALTNLAALESRRGRTTEALDYLRRAAALAPRDTSVHFNLGVLLAFVQQHAEAEPLLRAVVERSPGDQPARVAWGLTLLALDRHAEGLTALEAVTEVEAARCPNLLAALAAPARSPDEPVRRRAAALEARLRRLGYCAVPNQEPARNRS
jgi:tetratricopeptide (TPR) repeat protein